MKARFVSILCRLLGLTVEETSFARRGFRGSNPRARAHLERVGPVFMAGCHAALESPSLDVLTTRLAAVPLDWRGFAFEGAALGLALLDRLTPWRRDRVQRFLRGPGDPHAYVVHVGVGWVVARWPGRLEATTDEAPESGSTGLNAREAQRPRLDPLLRWLVIDGYGFHEGFFHWRRYLAGRPAPTRLQGYARRVFDQGLGRSLWFVDGADVELLPRTIAALPPERHADLWSGVGLAATYAGGVEEAELRRLREAAGPHRPHLAQGAAFAAKARQRAGNVTDHTRRATRVLCDLAVEEAAALTDAALENLPHRASVPAYETWRQRIQQAFARRHEDVRTDQATPRASNP